MEILRWKLNGNLMETAEQGYDLEAPSVCS